MTKDSLGKHAMGFWGRLRKRLSISKKTRKPKKTTISTQKKTTTTQIPPEPETSLDTPPLSRQSQEDSGSEIDVDHVEERDDFKELGAMWDGSQLDFKAGCDDRSLSYVPSSIEFGSDNFSVVSLMASPSVIAKENSARIQEESLKSQNSNAKIHVQNLKEDDGSIAIEVTVLPEKKQNQRNDAAPIPKEIVSKPKSSSGNSTRCPHNGPQAPKTRNQLLKYQKPTSTKSQMKNQVKSSFRYVPRNTEDNSVSIISC